MDQMEKKRQILAHNYPWKEFDGRRPIDIGKVGDIGHIYKPDLIDDAIPHLFLPKKTPECLQDNLEDVEFFLLREFSNSIKSIQSKVYMPQLDSVNTMLETWHQIQPKCDQDQHLELFIQEVMSLENNLILPIYVRKQNCTLLIIKRLDNIEVATFRASLPGEIVMSTVGSHAMMYPETMETIKNKAILESEEFAMQLHELSVGDIEIGLGKTTKGGKEYRETRDVADPRLVMDWIVGLLVPENVSGARPKLPQIWKKIRDQVTFSRKAAGPLPFRRSGMYMSIKVATQLKIVENFDNNLEVGKYVYKLLMLQILTDIANKFCKNYKPVDLNLASQILAKLGNRVRKLENVKHVSTENSKLVETIKDLKENCLKYTQSIVHELRTKMDKIWNNISSTEDQVMELRKSLGSLGERKRDYSNDFYHHIPSLDKCIVNLKELLAKTGNSNKTRTGNELQPVTRYLNSRSILSFSSGYRAIDERVWLYDAENYIKHICSSEVDGISVIDQILSKYASKAIEIYKDDPVGMSQLLLVSLKGLQILDKFTTKKFPLLTQYKSGMNLSTFDCLLLPFQDDIKLLDELVNYFSLREKNAVLSEIYILDKSIASEDFSVQYAIQDSNMKNLRERYLREMKNEIESKYSEVKSCRARCEEMKQKICRDPCQCTFAAEATPYRNRWGKLRMGKKKLSTCDRCRLQYQLRDVRKSVSRYEKKLPDDETFQWAAVFELSIPEEYAIWRDYLAYFKYEILGEGIFNGGGNNNISMKWSIYIGKASSSKKIILGSSSLPASRTYYTRTQNPDVLTEGNEDYIIDNGMGCYYHYETVGKPISCVKTACSFQLKDTLGYIPYANLQNMLESTTHTQNSVIARQHGCHEKLALSEFITFGSLRAGGRIQLRNLYEAIFSGTISLEEEPVLALILQTIWQVGPKNGFNQRESHLDFQDKIFAEEFLDMLEKLVKINAANYGNSQILLVAVMITRRIGELNGAMSQKCYDILKEWRTIMADWKEKIQAELDKSEVESSPYGGGSLKRNLLDVILCSLFSFSISDSSILEDVMKDEQDIVHWIQTLHKNNEAISEANMDISGFTRILVNFARILPLRLDLGEKIAKNDPKFIQSLHKFARINWNKAATSELKSIQIKDSIVLLEYTGENQLSFDFTMGSLLVNGFSQTTLPSGVLESKLFQRYFKDVTSLRVQQYDQNVTRTRTKFREKHYEFHQIRNCGIISSYCYAPSKTLNYHKSSSSSDDSSSESDDDDESDLDAEIEQIPQKSNGNNINVIIKEMQDDSSSTLILLDPEVLYCSISNFFIDNYSHWLDTSNDTIYFRPNSELIKDTSLPYSYILKKKLGDDTKALWALQEVSTDEYILNRSSLGFRLASWFLAKLELPQYINVTMNENQIRTAHLQRYNLRFILNDNGEHKSVEYPGFRIHNNQCVNGTLIGIEQGLVLIGGKGQILLVPHSSIQIRNKNSNYHQKVKISLRNLRQPPCFVYEVDDVLGRLKAHNSKSAWLYLAALHASTSSPLPDPFTGVTGTEMAVEILQSACVWSCSPYDKESQNILKFMKKLAPKRNYYGRPPSKEKNTSGEERGYMEVIQWPKGLGSMSAYDGFAIIVDALIMDSEKLAMLHSNSNGHLTSGDKDKRPPSASEKLRIRSYLRHLSMYNPLVAVEKPTYFIPSQLNLLKESGFRKYLPIGQSSEEFQLTNLLTISGLRQANCVYPLFEKKIIQKDNLTHFLISKEPLDTPFPGISLIDHDAFRNLLYLDFRYSWLKLYMMAINSKTSEEINAFTIILSAAAYRGAPIEQVANLHFISYCKSTGIGDFSPSPCFEIKPKLGQTSSYQSLPEYYGYDSPTQNNFNFVVVEAILKCHPKEYTETSQPIQPQRDLSEEFSKYTEKLSEYQDQLKEYQLQKEIYRNKVIANCVAVSRHLKTLIWPNEKVAEGGTVTEYLVSQNIEPSPVIKNINEHLCIWYRNYKLKLFVDELQSKLNSLYDKTLSQNHETIKIGTIPSGKTEILLEIGNNSHIEMEELIDETLARNREEAERIFRCAAITTTDGSFCAAKKLHLIKITNLKDDLINMMRGNTPSKTVWMSGIAPRIYPMSFLRNILAEKTSGKGKLIKEYAGALGVLWTNIKRINRCLRANNSSELERETNNPGHENWSPAEHPEWLLLELELDIMIRPVQVDVAKQMMSMPNGGNGVTQLNMGEGKTSVIVPMLCATLAKTDSQLCRVTVLSSMFKMNLVSLTFTIGGLLNRRVYWLPCRRDLQIDDDCIEKIKISYQECLNLQGVVLTLPEYRLSFRLLAHDKVLKKDTNLGLKMIWIENWLRHFARDILDESDELFSVKYQLVYTVGEHAPIDGGDIRWTTCQRILEIVKKVASNFLEDMKTKYEADVLEFKLNAENPHEFSTFRILNRSCFNEFIDLVADNILEEVMISQDQKRIVKNFIIQQEMDRIDHLQVMQSIFKETPEILNKILLVSGYLKRGVLTLALTKRWRVEYGINPKQGFRRMAVPYRAKDVAAEKTEFGHPDLAIILTHLSYYYSGLSDLQLQETFDILKGKQIPDAIYSSWMDIIPNELMPRSLLRYKSLNMKDADQRRALFELLRKHKMVIDFWLKESVFPRECKQFPGKLVMTAWDLCYERHRYPVTGFSGTNDSKVLLPLMISQQDLASLTSTNEKMEKTLLQPENDNHKGFGMGVTCREILESMKADNLTVLIDAGALMLELSDDQVADLWLEVNPDIEAAVYFNKSNDLLVKCREDKGEGISFDVSPYQGRLDKCGVFLDDQHTRGTDFKFPIPSKACVTVGTRMKRDKLIQAVMRMRKLGQGHSVTFYLSHEAFGKVMSDSTDDDLTTRKVLDWVCKNTRESNDDGLLYWALAGKNYAQRLAAEDHFHFPEHCNPSEVDTYGDPTFETKAGVLASQCVDDEIVKLKEMYGQYTQTELLSEIIPKWFAFAKAKLIRKNAGKELDARVMERFNEISSQIQEKIANRIPERQHVSANSGMMEEEQEKELELEKETEVEEERVVERPRKAEEVTPTLHRNVRNVVLNGGPIEHGKGGIVRLCDMFQGTTFWNEVQPECWSNEVWATNDFVSVIQEHRFITYHKTDEHLRPIQYMVSYRSQSESGTMTQFLVLSPFEVNELMLYFRSGQVKCKLHMFSLRRTEKQDLLLNNRRLQMPSSMDCVTIPANSMASASLLLASGSLYFSSMKEQQAFVEFLGIVPQPWSDKENEWHKNGWITKNGFLLPEHRKAEQLGFQRDPTDLVKKILLCRHSVVSELTHVMRLLDDKRKIELPDV